jgi:putative phosphotransacetylase
MNEKLAAEVAGKIAKRMERANKPVPVGVSNRHIHLRQDHWDALFGKGTQPRKLKDLKQLGQYAAYDTVSLVGPKGRLENVRVVGPHRSGTQIEISMTDSMNLGIKPPIRDSGKLQGSTGVKLIGPKGEVDLKEGVIVAKRHIHIAPSEAKDFGVSEGEHVRVRAGVGGERELVFERVLIRVSDQFRLEFHVDTDEANAAAIKSGDEVYLV